MKGQIAQRRRYVNKKVLFVTPSVIRRHILPTPYPTGRARQMCHSEHSVGGDTDG
jgi:hypothetical protein